MELTIEGILKAYGKNYTMYMHGFKKGKVTYRSKIAYPALFITKSFTIKDSYEEEMSLQQILANPICEFSILKMKNIPRIDMFEY
jgi:hypothetical protein